MTCAKNIKDVWLFPHDIAGIRGKTQHVAEWYFIFLQRAFQASKYPSCCKISDSHIIKMSCSDHNIVKKAHQDSDKFGRSTFIISFIGKKIEWYFLDCLSDWLLVLGVQCITAHSLIFVCLLPKSAAIFESGNILGKRSDKWSAVRKERLCKAIKFAI